MRRITRTNAPTMDHSSKSIPNFEGKLNSQDTQNEAHDKDKCKVNFE